MTPAGVLLILLAAALALAAGRDGDPHVIVLCAALWLAALVAWLRRATQEAS